MVRHFVAIFVALAITFTFATSALAHAEPAKVTPGDGAVLASPPAEVIIEMTQDMARQTGANDIDVFDAAGNEVTKIAAGIDNANRRKLTVGLPSDLAVGTYTVKWKTLSADDGDPAEGSLTFTYDPSKPPSPGKQDLAEGSTGAVPTQAPAPEDAAPVTIGGGGGGTSWILVAAVAVGMFVIGSGSTFFLVQKRP